VQWESDAGGAYRTRLRQADAIVDALRAAYQRAGNALTEYAVDLRRAQQHAQRGAAAEARVGQLLQGLRRVPVPRTDPLHAWEQVRRSREDEVERIRAEAQRRWSEATQAYDDAVREERAGRTPAVSAIVSAQRLVPTFFASGSNAEEAASGGEIDRRRIIAGTPGLADEVIQVVRSDTPNVLPQGYANSEQEEATIIRNRERVREELARITERMEHADGRELERLQRRAESYRILLMDPDVKITQFDPARDGRLVAVVGDINKHTNNVAVMVPGVGTSMDNAGDYIQHARALADDDTAVVFWMDGDFPNNPASAWNMGAAEALAPRLDRYVDGLRAEITQVGSDAKVGALLHSYGGAVGGWASHRFALDVDYMIHIASAGMGGPGVDGVEDYLVVDRNRNGRPDHSLTVFSVTAFGDAIDPPGGANYQNSPWRGADPGEAHGVREIPLARPPADWRPGPTFRLNPNDDMPRLLHGYYYFDRYYFDNTYDGGRGTEAFRQIKAAMDGQLDHLPANPPARDGGR
jgi:hypothetical protein